ncbi:hypothetical protein VN97_g12391, partial [Penicillium thymicola]
FDLSGSSYSLPASCSVFLKLRLRASKPPLWCSSAKQLFPLWHVRGP